MGTLLDGYQILEDFLADESHHLRLFLIFSPLWYTDCDHWFFHLLLFQPSYGLNSYENVNYRLECEAYRFSTEDNILADIQNLACRFCKWLDELAFRKWNCDHVYVSLLESRNCFQTKGGRYGKFYSVFVSFCSYKQVLIVFTPLIL